MGIASVTTAAFRPWWVLLDGKHLPGGVPANAVVWEHKIGKVD